MLTLVYDWIGDDNFRSYVDELIDKYTDSELSRVWKALMKLIDKGDFQAIKLYFELKGKYKDTVGRSNAKRISKAISCRCLPVPGRI